MDLANHCAAFPTVTSKYPSCKLFITFVDLYALPSKLHLMFVAVGMAGSWLTSPWRRQPSTRTTLKCTSKPSSHKHLTPISSLRYFKNKVIVLSCLEIWIYTLHQVLIWWNQYSCKVFTVKGFELNVSLDKCVVVQISQKILQNSVPLKRRQFWNTCEVKR
jgi:hypothetical protein